MCSLLAHKKIVLGVTGSVAAYKTLDWVRCLGREGAKVNVVLTESAARFVTPLTFAALSGNRVYGSMFATADMEKIPHIKLAREADLVLVAPATAQTIARLAHGFADDLLAAIILASQAKIVICPAMNSRMYLHAATRQNLKILRDFGYTIIAPDSGSMACGEVGPGRLPEWDVVRQALFASFSPQDLRGKTVLITAGPTHEPLDPVRYLGNRSSGKMGYALAAVAGQRGAEVILLSGPAHITPPAGVKVIKTQTAVEMHDATLKYFPKADIIIKAAAVSDFRPAERADQKIKKNNSDLNLKLTPNPDILLELGKMREKRKTPLILAGFAAESENHLQEGQRKLQDKNLDLLVVNDILAADSGFAVDSNRVTMLFRSKEKIELPLLSKEETARCIIDEIVRLGQG
jgi:phosphopantothenoylcysteine decarboxylase/phosphopantothenate--cysteine ligase